MSRVPLPEPDARDRILDAAERAFSRSGLAGARVAAIAEEASVNKAMLYYYFGSKEALFEAVMARTGDRVVAVARETLDRPDVPPARRILDFVDEYRELVRSLPHFVRMLNWDLLDGGRFLKRLVVPRWPTVAGLVMRAVREGQADGTIRPELAPWFVLPNLIAPYVLFAAGRSFVEELLPVDPDPAWQLFKQTARAMSTRGFLAVPIEEIR